MPGFGEKSGMDEFIYYQKKKGNTESQPYQYFNETSTSKLRSTLYFRHLIVIEPVLELFIYLLFLPGIR